MEPADFKKKLLELEARVGIAEEELRILRASNETALRVEELRQRVEQQRSTQKSLEIELARQGKEIEAGAKLTQEILRSRIWRTLAHIGGIMLRLRARKEASQEAPPVSLAFASRQNSIVRTKQGWIEIVRRAVEVRPRSVLAAPRISIITPTWNTRIAWLAEAAVSVLEQSCADWEWCIVDDGSKEIDFHILFPILEETGRVKVRKLDSRHGISGATNQGLHMSSGEYVCFLDHDDLLAPTAVAKCLEALGHGLDAVYTDHDKIDEAGVRWEPFYKPDWSPEYFRGVMYICHFLCVRRDLALQIGGFDERYDSVQDFEFMLRFSEQTSRIGHVQEVLYHWRAAPGSVAASQDAKGNVGKLQKMAVQEHLTRLQLPAIAESGPATHTVNIAPLRRNIQPKVSIVLLGAYGADLLDTCLLSILKKTRYENFEIICIDGGGTRRGRSPNLTNSRVKHIAMVSEHLAVAKGRNLAADQADGEYLVLMTGCLEVLSQNWIGELLYYSHQNDVGAAGGLVMFPDGAVQHAGIVLDSKGGAHYMLEKAPADSTGYFGLLCCAREVSAMTSAYMIRRELFERAGRFNEAYSATFQDVDLCLRVRSSDLRNIYTPRARFCDVRSESCLPARLGDAIASSDPYYNRNLNLEPCDYTTIKDRFDWKANG